MIEIKNKTRGPIQTLIRSRKAPKAFTTLNIPGIGAGKNVVYIEDERKTDWIDRLVDFGLITIRTVSDKILQEKNETVE